MGILEDISASIAAWNKKKTDQVYRNAALQEKIDRLENAKRLLDLAYQDSEAMVQSVRNYDPSALWAGQKFNYNKGYRDAVRDAGKSLGNDVLDNYKAICDKITQLENERFEGWAFISTATACINNLTNDWWKAWYSINATSNPDQHYY